MILFNQQKHRKRFNPAKFLLLGYLSVILLGAVLLMLPISHQAGVNVTPLMAIFTSTSATSITGLVVTNTAETWSMFGRVVILCLIQLGALGFMTLTTIFFFLMNKKIGLSQRLLIAQSFNLRDRQGVVRLICHVLIGTLIIQGIGTLLLWVRFVPSHGAWRGLGMGAFHAIAAFANAGFDLFGGSYNPLADDGVMAATVMLLAIIGGLGFFVWEDLYQNKFRLKRLHLHSKLVLSISFWLIVLGWIFFFVAERGNPYTIGHMNLPDAIQTSLFQSVMPRSAGFSIIEQGQLFGVTRMVVMMLMFIGGSAGSTAGGVKNVTVGILFLSAIHYFRGKKEVSAFSRTIPMPQIKSALAISVIVLCAILFGSITIALLQPYLSFSAILFEVISAIATCGLSYGITGVLSPASQVVIIIFMFCGRVGIMTLGMAAFLKRDVVEKIKYPDTWVMMG